MFTQEKSFATVFFMSLVLSTTVPRSAGQVSFANPVSYKVGTAPVATAVGDFNGDGKMDLAVLNSGNAAIGDDGGVSVLLGNGDGTMQAATNFPAGQNPTAIAAADFNHDGKLDLVVLTVASTGTVAILLGNGDGTFQTPTDVPIGGVFVNRLATGDFNGDGKADLALLENDNAVGILLSNGDGTFRTGDTYEVSGATSLVVGDFNGDGQLDIAVGTSSNCVLFEGCQGGLSVFLSNGDGTFQPSVDTGTGGLSSFVTGDFNGDGKLDVAIDSRFFREILLGQGNGTFQALPSASGFTGQTGDFNGDSKLDLSVLNGTRLSVQLGNGDGTFQNLPSLSLGTSPTTFEGAVVDLNGDGLADLVALDSTNILASVVLNTTPGFRLTPSPSSATTIAGGSATYTINIGQQNGFANAATLTCSAPASVGIQCSISSSSASPGSSTKLTVTTTGLSAALRLPGNRGNAVHFGLWLPVVGFAVFGIGVGSPNKGRKKLLGVLLFCLVFGSLTFLLACGGSTNSGGAKAVTPSGNYTISVTGTAVSLQRSTTVTLNVQ